MCALVFGPKDINPNLALAFDDLGWPEPDPDSRTPFSRLTLVKEKSAKMDFSLFSQDRLHMLHRQRLPSISSPPHCSA